MTGSPVTAVILAGAVGKGAFQAGVLSVLADQVPEVARIVAASAGSLNAAVYAAGVRYRRQRAAAQVLIDAWLDEGTWCHILRPSASGVLRRRGFSSSEAVAAIVRENMTKVAPAGDASAMATRDDVVLQMIAATLRGKLADRGPATSPAGATTFEHVVEFGGADLDSADGRARIATAATASAAFPLLFLPVTLDPVGPCIDGGAVNNTPIAYALDSPGVERVLVVTDNPRQTHGEPPARGVALVGRLAEILINERLFRDLREAEIRNDRLARLEALAAAWGLDAARRAELMAVLDWRPVEIVQIRPERPLAGTPFSALGDRDLRARYIAEGQRVAARALTS